MLKVSSIYKFFSSKKLGKFLWYHLVFPNYRPRAYLMRKLMVILRAWR